MKLYLTHVLLIPAIPYNMYVVCKRTYGMMQSRFAHDSKFLEHQYVGRSGTYSLLQAYIERECVLVVVLLHPYRGPQLKTGLYMFG